MWNVAYSRSARLAALTAGGVSVVLGMVGRTFALRRVLREPSGRDPRMTLSKKMVPTAMPHQSHQVRQKLASGRPIKRPGCRQKLRSTPARRRLPLECSPASAALTSLVVASTLCLLVQSACTNVHASQVCECVCCPVTVSSAVSTQRTDSGLGNIFCNRVGTVVCPVVRWLLLVVCVQVMEAMSAASAPRESGALEGLMRSHVQTVRGVLQTIWGPRHQALVVWMSVVDALQVGKQFLAVSGKGSCLCNRAHGQQLSQASKPAVLLKCVCVCPCAGFGGSDCEVCPSQTYSEGGCLPDGVTDACLRWHSTRSFRICCAAV